MSTKPVSRAGIVALTLLLLAAQGCTQNSAPPSGVPSTPPATTATPADTTSKYGLPQPLGLELEPKPELHLLSATEAAALGGVVVLNPECQSLQPTRPRCDYRITLSPVPDTVKVGTVLNVGVTRSTPNGLLARVTEIQGGVVLASEATLDEAVAQGEFRGERGFTAADVAIQTIAAGVRPLAAIDPAGGAGAVEFLVSRGYDFNNQNFGFAYDLDTELAEGVRINGQLYFNFGCAVDIGITYKWHIIPTGVRFANVCAIDQGAHVTVTATKAAVVEKDYLVASLSLNNIVITTPYVVLVFVPTVDITVNARGEAKAEVSFSVDQNIHARAGLSYNNGFAGDADVGANFSTGTGEKCVSVTLEAGATVGFKLMLYGVQGSSNNLYTGLVFNAQLPRKPLWSLALHALLSTSLNLDLKIKEFVWGPAPIYEKTFAITEAPNEAPDLSLAGIKDGDSVYAAGSVVLLPQFTLTASDPEGEAVTAVWGESSLDGSLGAIGNASPRTLALNTVGTHVLTFHARDAQGAESKLSVTVKVTRPVPKLSLQVTDLNGLPLLLVGGGVSGQQGKYFLVKANLEAGVPGGSVPACSTLTWSGGGLPLANDGTCIATLSLSQQGQFTITVGSPGLDSRSVKVTVTAPPDKPLPPQYGAIRILVGGVDMTGYAKIPYGDITLSVSVLATPPVGFQPAYVWEIRKAGATTWTPLTTAWRESSSGSSRTTTVSPATTYDVRLRIYDTAGSAIDPIQTLTRTFTTMPKVS